MIIGRTPVTLRSTDSHKRSPIHLIILDGLGIFAPKTKTRMRGPKSVDGSRPRTSSSIVVCTFRSGMASRLDRSRHRWCKARFARPSEPPKAVLFWHRQPPLALVSRQDFATKVKSARCIPPHPVRVWLADAPVCFRKTTSCASFALCCTSAMPTSQYYRLLARKPALCRPFSSW